LHLFTNWTKNNSPAPKSKLFAEEAKSKKKFFGHKNKKNNHVFFAF